jgi:hypothetical protein
MVGMTTSSNLTRLCSTPTAKYAQAREHSAQGSQSGRGWFRHWRYDGVAGCPPETNIHNEILKPANIPAQIVSAIGVSPEIEFVPIALGKQQTIDVQEGIYSGILGIRTDGIDGVVVNITATGGVKIARIGCSSPGGIQVPAAARSARRHIEVAAVRIKIVVPSRLDINLSGANIAISIVKGYVVKYGTSSGGGEGQSE